MAMWVAVRRAVAVEHQFRTETKALAKPVALKVRTRVVASKATPATMLGVFGRVHRLRLPSCQLRL